MTSVHLPEGLGGTKKEINKPETDTLSAASADSSSVTNEKLKSDSDDEDIAQINLSGSDILEQINSSQLMNTEVTKPSEKAKAWADENTWFGQDKVMTNAAFSIHEDLVTQGFDPESDEYYTEIDKRILKSFPQQGNQARPTQKVASAVRTSPSGRRTVKLTPSQVAIAKKLGVPLEEYAKHVKE